MKWRWLRRQQGQGEDGEAAGALGEDELLLGDSSLGDRQPIFLMLGSIWSLFIVTWVYCCRCPTALPCTSWQAGTRPALPEASSTHRQHGLQQLGPLLHHGAQGQELGVVAQLSQGAARRLGTAATAAASPKHIEGLVSGGRRLLLLLGGSAAGGRGSGTRGAGCWHSRLLQACV